MNQQTVLASGININTIVLSKRFHLKSLNMT